MGGTLPAKLFDLLVGEPMHNGSEREKTRRMVEKRSPEFFFNKLWTLAGKRYFQMGLFNISMSYS